MTWRTVQTFRMRPEVEKVLSEIPYGEKSDFINTAITEKLALKEIASNLELPNEKPVNGKLRTKVSPLDNSIGDSTKFTNSNKTSNDQAASATAPSKDKSQNTLKKLLSDGQ